MVEKKEIYKRALAAWGKNAQMLQVVEEMSELTKEIIKNVNRDKHNIDEIVEEAADVEIMLEQLKSCYNIENAVAEYKEKKLNILEKRIIDWEKCK